VHDIFLELPSLDTLNVIGLENRLMKEVVGARIQKHTIWLQKVHTGMYYFSRYIYEYTLQVLNNVRIINTNVILPQEATILAV
jgi:hypothetical protein